MLLTLQYPWEDVTLFTGKETGTEKCIILSDSHSVSLPFAPYLGFKKPSKMMCPHPPPNPAVPKVCVLFDMIKKKHYTGHYKHKVSTVHSLRLASSMSCSSPSRRTSSNSGFFGKYFTKLAFTQEGGSGGVG